MRNKMLLKMISESKDLNDLKSKVYKFVKENEDDKYYFNFETGKIQLGCSEYYKSLINIGEVKNQYIKYIDQDRNNNYYCYYYLNGSFYKIDRDIDCSIYYNKTSKIPSNVIQYLHKLNINEDDLSIDKWLDTREKLKERFRYTSICNMVYFEVDNLIINYHKYDRNGGCISFYEKVEPKLEDILFYGIKSCYPCSLIVEDDTGFINYLNDNIIKEITE